MDLEERDIETNIEELMKDLKKVEERIRDIVVTKDGVLKPELGLPKGHPLIKFLDKNVFELIERNQGESTDKRLKDKRILENLLHFQKGYLEALLTLTKKTETFAIPSHPLMFTLLAMFSGKPNKIPRKLLEKPHSQRTPEERKEAEEFCQSILQEKITGYDGTGGEEKTTYALVCDNPKIHAKAEIDNFLFSGDPIFQEERIAHYIKRTYGPEGLRHLLGLIIGLEENFRQGHFNFNVNEHLDRLGYKKETHGGYDSEAKRTATEIVKIFTGLMVTAHSKIKNREVIEGERLFNIDGFKKEMIDREIINETIKLRATDFWYKNAFEPKDGKSPKFTKLLKRVAQENHRNHPLTIYLTPLFAIWWRMNPEEKIKVNTLMEWCSLDPTSKNAHRYRVLGDLEAELNYMKDKGYLGDWTTQEGKNPSECEDPFSSVLTLTPPEWLKDELIAIQDSKKKELPAPVPQPTLLDKDEMGRLINNMGMTIKQFANNLGVSRQMIQYILSGKKKMTPNIDRKIKEQFGEFLPL